MLPHSWTFRSRVVSALRELTCHMYNHTVSPATRERRCSRCNPIRSWYSIYLPRRDEKSLVDLSQLVRISCSRVLRDEQKAAARTRNSGGFFNPIRGRASCATGNDRCTANCCSVLRADKDQKSPHIVGLGPPMCSQIVGRSNLMRIN